MVFAGHVLGNSNFSATLQFLKWKTQSLRVKTIRVLHYAINRYGFEFDQKKVVAIFQLLTTIPSDSLTYFECVHLQVQHRSLIYRDNANAIPGCLSQLSSMLVRKCSLHSSPTCVTDNAD
jgi:hypothetical protein